MVKYRLEFLYSRVASLASAYGCLITLLQSLMYRISKTTFNVISAF
jgi:hypothetical protein